MTNTRQKLEEARYFLTRMAEEVTNREPFKYDLSAFLSAARSVTFVMKKEFNNIHGYKEWYDEKQKVLGSDPLMQLMNNKRVMTIHQKPIQPSAHIDVSCESTIVFTEHVVAILTHKDGTVERIEYKQEPPPVPKPKEEQTEEVNYRWYFEDIPDKDILTLSQSYIERLESLVSECESKFTLEQVNE